IIEAKYQRSVKQILYRLQSNTTIGWDPVRTPDRSLWDHWKDEILNGHSDNHDLLEELIGGIVRDHVESLPNEDGALLTLATDEYYELDQEPLEPTFWPKSVMAELMKRVSDRAHAVLLD